MLKPWPTTAGEDVPSPDDEEVSLFRSGLFYRAQLLTHLIEAGRWNIPRRVAFLLAVGWLPLLILTLLFYRDDLPVLLKDYLLYSRIIIAVPVLLAGQILMEDRFCVIVSHVRRAELLGREDLTKLKGVIAVIKRLGNSPLPELIILVLVALEVWWFWDSKLLSGPGWAVDRSSEVAHLKLTGWYYGLVSVPIYQFLLGLNLWKWLLWVFFLLRLSRMDLKLIGTHPDEHGGLGFLGLLPIGFVPISVAVSTAVGGAWRNEMLTTGKPLAGFLLPAIILTVLNFIVALGPLVPYVRRLAGLRKKAILEYGVLAQNRATDFNERWIVHRGSHEPASMAPEISTLADLSISYGNIQRLRPFPADKNTLISLAVAVLLPLFPVVLTEIPFSVIVKGLVDAIKAAPM
jgi:hypothetical protein